MAAVETAVIITVAAAFLFGGRKRKKKGAGVVVVGPPKPEPGDELVLPGVGVPPTDVLNWVDLTDSFAELDLSLDDKLELLRGVAFTTAELGRAYGEILARGNKLQRSRAATNLAQLEVDVAKLDDEPGDGTVLPPVARRIGVLVFGMARMLSLAARADAQASVLLGASDPDWDVPLGLVIDTVVAAWRSQGGDELADRVLAALLGVGG